MKDIEAEFEQLREAIDTRQAEINAKQQEIAELSADANRLQGAYSVLQKIINEETLAANPDTPDPTAE